MNWTQVASDFEFDGSLRDIRVLDASVVDWQRVLNALRHHVRTFSFTLNGVATDLPIRAEDALALGKTSHPLLSFEVSGVRINCHFFRVMRSNWT